MTETKLAVSGYLAEFEQGADGSWEAIVPDLPTIIAAADNLEECKALVAEAIALWLQAAKENGETIPAPTH